jgi:hypothetical protein
VVRLVQRRKLLREDDVGDNDPGEEGLALVSSCSPRTPIWRGFTYNRQREALFVEVGVVHETTRQADDDQGDEDLESADDEHPNRRLEDVRRRVLRGL